MATITSKNPYNWEINWTVETLTDEQLVAVIDQAHEAYLSWKETSFEERKNLFLKMADIIDEERKDISQRTTREMWMLQWTSQKILVWTANLIRWYANNAERILSDEPFSHDWLTGKYTYDSLGVIFWIAPWNFPYNQLLRAAVANIMAGNTSVYKHASNVPFCAWKIQELFDKAWFPQGVYTTLYMSSSQSETVIAHKHIRWVNLTWWERAWSAIGALAWKYLKPSVLELWWNDAFVLLDHENTEAIAAQAVTCRLSMLWWQRCNSSKRFIILDKHYDAFVAYLKKHMELQVIWDPMDPATLMPPLARKDLVDEVHDQVQRTIADGATLITGWEFLWDSWQFYAPTILGDVTPAMTSFKEEIFGPVATVIRSSSVEESIALANWSDFWLSAVVFGDDIEQCKEVADKLEWWMVFVNNPAGSKASLPFWWVKKSWYWKENWPEGLRAFTNKKAVIHSIE